MQPAQRHLVLLRHAKSAWPNGVPDLRRPLAKRGRRDAAALGCWLHEHAPRLDAHGAADYTPADPDPDAVYADVRTVDLSGLEPYVARPGKVSEV